MITTQFCKDFPKSIELFNLIQEKIITMNPEEVKAIYSTWSNNYDNNEKHNDKVLDVDRINPSILTEKNRSNGSLFGIDFPSWFGDYNSGKRIMIVGIDPLRNEVAFKNSDKKNNVIIGTPYGFHNSATPKVKKYAFAKQLSEKNFIYLTDIFKIYFKLDKGARRSYDIFSEEKNHFRLILLKELEIINPDLIISLGHLADFFFKSIIKQTDIAYKNLKHPSARPNILLKFLTDEGQKESTKHDDIKSSYSNIINNILLKK
ncbi:Uracil DNA glycosylase superfamily protein [Niabella drilacis]|uniref:Uracil DNA glycosylase superfamily protein n=2 Tax=Niabella drilacis (strain DSM 25811 / CCM 8410 / CCUG 62505 / LMG 26954 / E90) TaxID=1285928 RepID=A0A1G6T8M1_NIADE|nr:Uracil DNA glycosylase superfamily protein [Niabella drilacis]